MAADLGSVEASPSTASRWRLTGHPIAPVTRATRPVRRFPSSPRIPVYSPKLGSLPLLHMRGGTSLEMCRSDD